MYNRKHEALAILREVAQTSDFNNRRKLYYVHNLVSGKQEHRNYKKSVDWGFLGWLAFGFVLVLTVAFFQQ